MNRVTSRSVKSFGKHLLDPASAAPAARIRTAAVDTAVDPPARPRPWAVDHSAYDAGIQPAGTARRLRVSRISARVAKTLPWPSLVVSLSPPRNVGPRVGTQVASAT